MIVIFLIFGIFDIANNLSPIEELAMTLYNSWIFEREKGGTAQACMGHLHSRKDAWARVAQWFLENEVLDGESSEMFSTWWMNA